MAAHVPLWIGVVEENGTLQLDDKRAFMAYIQKFKGYEVQLTIRKRQHRQGDPAMRYYRGVVVPIIAEYMGESDPEAAHEAIAWKFLRIEDHPVTGAPRRRSTNKDDLTREELSAYIDNVILWAETDLGLRIPRPHEVEAA